MEHHEIFKERDKARSRAEMPPPVKCNAARHLVDKMQCCLTLFREYDFLRP